MLPGLIKSRLVPAWCRLVAALHGPLCLFCQQMKYLHETELSSYSQILDTRY